MTERTISHQQKAPATRITHSVDYLPALFLVVALWFIPIKDSSPALNSLAIVFISIVLEAIPFMFVGSLVGGLVEAFVSRERMTSFLPEKGWLTVCIAAGAGVVFPVCECAVVPVVRRLIGKGLPLSAAIGYLLAGPIVNPIVATSTALAYAFDWRVVALRLLLGYGIAVSIGLLMGRIFNQNTAIKAEFNQFESEPAVCVSAHHYHSGHDRADGCCVERGGFPIVTNEAENLSDNCECSQTARIDGWIDKIGAAFHHAVDDFLAIGHYLVIGAFIAALAQTYIERSSFLNIAEIPVLSIVLMIALAVLLNLCSEADAFIAASFRGLMPMSSQMAFMLIGPMFDLKLLLMYQSIFRRKAIVILASLVVIFVLSVSFALELINGIVL